jgi:signal transduction histidine kinase/CheY-like chemotaxis protein
VNKAFETGYCRFDWTHIIPDKGEEFPADVTLVRSKYKNEDVVLGYSRDLREQYALMASIRYRDRMLQAVNEVAVMLLESDTDCFAEALRKSMSKIAGTVKADCVYVWKNHTVNGELFCKQMCEWSENNTVFAGDDTLYKYSETFPGWEVALANGESQNGPVSSFTESVQEFLKPVGALSILVLPIFIKEQFWGFIGFDDFKEERVFSKEEESILKSASLLIASAFVRNAMYDDIKSGSEELLRRDKIMYAVNTAAGILLNADSGFFNDSLKISMKLIAVAANVHCVYLWQNKTVDGELCCFQLFEWSESETKFTDGELYKYDEVVPGWKETLSAEKCINSIVRNLSREEQDHLTGILSIFVVPVFIRNEFWGFVGFDDRNEERIFSSEEGSILHSASLIVANSFIRNEMVHDIRETATQLEQSSNLLKTVNQVATTLLTTQEGEDITHSLNVGMELIGNAMKVDRVHIWRNEVVDGALRFMHAYSWLNEVGENMAVVPAGAMTPFKDHTKWLIKFMRNEYVGGGASKMTENEREYFKEFDVKSVVLIPLFLDEDFWGVVSIDDCMAERDFTEEEIAILRSASLVMASVINRHTLVEKRTVQLTMQAAQLKEMEAAAVAASQSKSVFLANMSHEIRTPMNAILGITEILIQNEGLPEEIDEGLGKIYNSCDMLLRIINDILDFSKIEAGRLDITPANYCVASLLNDSVHLNMMRIESKPIEFEVNVNKDVPAKLVGDELRIKQILNNLLSNAFKYTEKGKVILSVSYEPTDFESLVSFVIKVTDTGVGMSEEQLETMFNEYSRFAENSNSTVEGTGLGLAITQRLINLMDGQIEVESKPGVGSTFTVRFLQGTVDDEILGEEVAGNLQFFRDYYKKTRNRRSLVRYPMPYGKVLIVDDVETNVYVAAGLMKPYKLQIDSATSGQEAIDKIALGEVYDVIFMDHMMPGMNGIEATHKLREMNYTNPIVALTANAVAGQADMFLQNGFDAFISKPVDIRQLDTLLIHLVRDRHPPEVVAAARNESIGITSETPAAKSLLSDKSVQGIDISRGLERYNGDEEIYLRVLRSYAASVRSMVGVIESVSEKSLPDYEIKIHGIKGTSRDIFAQDIGESAAKLETAAKEKDILYINEHNSGFVKVLCEFLDRLDELLRIVDEQNPRELKEKLDEKLLVQLREACKVYDMDGADSAINEIEMFSYKSQSDLQLAEWLRERFDLMKFDEIVDKLDN